MHILDWFLALYSFGLVYPGIEPLNGVGRPFVWKWRGWDEKELLV